MKRVLICIAVCGFLAAQPRKTSPIIPDGLTKRTEDHRVDLSACDTVTIEGNIRDLNVSSGEFRLYVFRKYLPFTKLEITCTMEFGVRPR